MSSQLVGLDNSELSPTFLGVWVGDGVSFQQRASRNPLGTRLDSAVLESDCGGSNPSSYFPTAWL